MYNRSKQEFLSRRNVISSLILAKYHLDNSSKECLKNSFSLSHGSKTSSVANFFFLENIFREIKFCHVKKLRHQLAQMVFAQKTREIINNCQSYLCKLISRNFLKVRVNFW